MTKKALIERVAGMTGATQKSVDTILRATFDAIWRMTRQSGRFAYPGFGVWSVRVRKARRIRNPQTNEIMTLPADKTIGFHVATGIKKQL